MCNVSIQSYVSTFSDDLDFIKNIHYCQFICAFEVVKRNLPKATGTVGPAELQTLLYKTPCLSVNVSYFQESMVVTHLNTK